MKLLQSLRTRVMLSFLVVAVIPISAMLLLNYQQLRKELVTIAGDKLLESTFLLARDIERLLEQRQSEIKVISLADVLQTNDTQEITKYVSNIEQQSDFISGIEVYSLDNQLVASSHNSISSVKLNSWPASALALLERAKTGKQGDIYFSELFWQQQRAQLKIISPIVSAQNGKVLTVLVTTLATDQITEILVYFEQRIAGDIPIQIIDNDGFVILASDAALHDQKFIDLKVAPNLLYDLETQGQNVVRQYSNHLGTELVASFADMSEFGINRGLDWSIYAAAPKSLVLQSVRPVLSGSNYLFLAIVFIALLAGYIISRSITRPVELLTEYAEDSDIDVSKLKGAKEIKRLRDHMVTAKTRLEQINAQLEQLVEERTEQLTSTQNQVIEQEKMASLGRMVAGISHEINTPLGIIVTAISHLSEKNNELQTRFQQQSLTAQQLELYLEELSSCSEIIDSASNKAVALIQSFKQVAVDQTNEQSRQVNLKVFLKEAVLTLSPKFKNLPYQIHQSADDADIEIEVGILYQIISNLVLNALIHGFEGRDHGNIFIRIKLQQNNLLLEISDDGKGMNAEQLAKIFEPFYTTKRGRGGTGLGTHIVYNIVTQRLKGQIGVDSEIARGVHYTITFPVKKL